MNPHGSNRKVLHLVMDLAKVPSVIIMFAFGWALVMIGERRERP